ncbi:MAG: hypothetical protein V9G19_01075 [Tetrasphaera sp.]
MTTASSTAVVNTVLGPVPTAELGVVAVHEALLSVLPGAQFAPDITIDRAEVFGILAWPAAGVPRRRRRHGRRQHRHVPRPRPAPL